MKTDKLLASADW